VHVSFDDRAINAGGKSEVIGIDDQVTHRASLSGQEIGRGGRMKTALRLTDFSLVGTLSEVRFAPTISIESRPAVTP
jgi:hypothetical protein